MSITEIGIIIIIVLGLIVTIAILRKRWKPPLAASPPELEPIDIHVTYENSTKRGRLNQWKDLKQNDYTEKPTGWQTRLFPCKVTVLYKYRGGREETKVYYAKPEAVHNLGFRD